jgi:hypothetical protein
MSSVAVNVEGFDKLVAQIRKLANDKDKRREMLILLRQIANPTLKAAKVFAPISKRKHKARGKLIAPGNLKKSLGTITGKSENPTILVGPRAKGSFDGWYGHFVHDGVNLYNKGYKRKKVGRGVNNHAAIAMRIRNPFLTKAYNATNGTVTADAERKFVAYIQRRVEKLS